MGNNKQKQVLPRRLQYIVFGSICCYVLFQVRQLHLFHSDPRTTALVKGHHLLEFGRQGGPTNDLRGAVSKPMDQKHGLDGRLKQNSRNGTEKLLATGRNSKSSDASIIAIEGGKTGDRVVASPLHRHGGRTESAKKKREWVSIPEPKVPAGFVPETFWNLIEDRARNSSLVPTLVHRIREKNFSNMPRVPVVFWPMVALGSQIAEHKHVNENGVDESKYLMLQNNISFHHDPNLVWVANPGLGWTWLTWCDELTNVVKTAIVERYQAGLSTRWPIIIAVRSR
mmetsp:Transcript_36186/g.75255  ORF Transcript_36186/g.75255 Transcript_36186/m.75255 type:complete len:283 (-) Transcript_36186:3233-4081(-)